MKYLKELAFFDQRNWRLLRSLPFPVYFYHKTVEARVTILHTLVSSVQPPGSGPRSYGHDLLHLGMSCAKVKFNSPLYSDLSTVLM